MNTLLEILGFFVFVFIVFISLHHIGNTSSGVWDGIKKFIIMNIVFGLIYTAIFINVWITVSVCVVYFIYLYIVSDKTKSEGKIPDNDWDPEDDWIDDDR
jgi:hypothetical protein